MVEPERDKYGRPMIVPPGGGDPVAYTRASTLGGNLSDTFALTLWKMRQVALGLAKRADLLTAVGANWDDSEALNKLCEQALEAAGGNAGAIMGTALHKLAEIVDSDLLLPDFTPPLAAQRIDLYQRCLAGANLQPESAETFVANDYLRAAGTFDRLLRTCDGRALVADLKTGASVHVLETAVQLAVYAGGQRYDPATGQRTPIDANLDSGWAVIIHLPAKSGPCRLITVDLDKARDKAVMAAGVRDIRSTRGLIETRFVLED